MAYDPESVNPPYQDRRTHRRYRRVPGTVGRQERQHPDSSEMCKLRAEGLTLQAIADKFGYTRERVRQIIAAIPKAAKVLAAYKANRAARPESETKRLLRERHEANLIVVAERAKRNAARDSGGSWLPQSGRR